MSENIERFNTMVGVMLDQLYRSFPVPAAVDFEEVYSAVGLDYSVKNVPSRTSDGHTVTIVLDNEGNDVSDEFRVFGLAAFEWLRAEDFIRTRSLRSSLGAVLTSKALLAMNAKLGKLDPSLGTQLGDVVKDAGKTAGNSAISETVGLIIGAAVKGFNSAG